MNEIQIGKVPPQAPDLEQAVIGALLIDKDAIHAVANILMPEDYYASAHETIFRAILDLFRSSAPIDLLTVTERLTASGDLDSIGAYYLVELTNRVASAANVEYHARIILQKAIARNSIELGRHLVSSGFDPSVDPLALLDESEVRLSKIKDRINLPVARNKSDMAMAALDLMAEAAESDGMTGLHPFPSKHMNRLTKGGKGGQLILIAARPSMGKSILAVCMACELSVRQGIPGVFWSLEMTNEEILFRMVSHLTGIDAEEIERGEHVNNHIVHEALSKIVNSPLELIDRAGVTINQVRSTLITLKRTNGIQYALIDHGRLIKLNRQGGISTNDATGEVSRIAKQTAKELDLPIFMLWQLSRATESRAGSIPSLSDLRNSGELEEDADKVIFLYRPSRYGILEYEYTDVLYDQEPLTMSTEKLMICIVAKHRGGRIGETLLKFSPETMNLFPNIAEDKMIRGADDNFSDIPF